MVKTIKKCFIALAAFAVMGSCMNTYASANEVQDAVCDYNRLITEIPADADFETALRIEKRNSKHITAIQVLFDDDSYKTYNKLASGMKKAGTMEAIEEAVNARKNLIQIESVEDRVWFIWDGTEMPCVDGEEFTEEELDKSQMFGYGYEPVAIKYLVEDQSQCKGNIIACSGGAMKIWANGSEGYPAAKVFNDLGYNFFLLQRRVEPYSEMDIFMDFQRLVRLVKYHAELEGYGGQDMYAGVGWSGGSWTLNGAISYFYGDITPAAYDSDYISDEVDAYTPDLDVALSIYGGGLDFDAGNENLPCYFICHGTEDSTIDPQTAIDMYNKLVEIGVPAELDLIEGAEHGFGVGLAPATGQAPGTDEWPAKADQFMMKCINK